MDGVELKRLENERTLREAQNLRVYVVGGGFMYLKMFLDAGFRGARNVKDADIVCFTGGEDVDPALYGEKALPTTYFNSKRDADESIIYAECYKTATPMIGICRGSQFLTVMNGGKLYQHVNNHGVRDGHEIVDMKSGETITGMTSTHHQMMIPAQGGEVLALAAQSTLKQTATTTEERTKPLLDDVEVVWYPDSLSLCFQPHPEFGHGHCRNYFLDLVDEYIIPAT